MKHINFAKFLLLLATFSLFLCDEIPAADAEPGLSAADAKTAHSYLIEGEKHYRAGNMKEAFSWFLRSAKLGDASSQLQAGFHYEKGLGVRQDYAAAAAWYRKAAEQGDEGAMKNLGTLYEVGMGVEEDWKQAAQWYRKGAEKNYAPAESALAAAYQFGIGVPQNRAESIYWNKRARDHGDASCEYWYRWLRSPTNFIGFRNDQERNLVMGGQLSTTGLLCGADPAGWLFVNSAKRLDWLRGLRSAVDQAEAKSRLQTQEFDKRERERKRLEQGVR